MNTQPVASDFDEELFGFDFLAELDRQPVDEQSDYLDAGDVHMDGPIGVVTPFKVCQSCSGSTAPTCKKNKHCLAEKAFAWDESAHERGKTTPTSRGGSFAPVDLNAAAKAIHEMDPDKRDNTEIGDFPGHASGYNLYEAQKMLPKPSDKLKRVTENNSFHLWQEYDYIANVDGHHFGIGKYEDPDEPDDELKFIFAFKRLDSHDGMTETTTDQVPELFQEMRSRNKFVLEWQRMEAEAKKHAEENGVWRTVRGRKVFIREGETPTEAVKRSITERSARSTANYIPCTKAKRDKAEKFEASVAKLINGKNLGDHEPFDVIAGKNAVEVKALMPGSKNPKLTMHPDSLLRKNQFLQKAKMIGHTVAVDARGDKPIYYYASGVGSFRLSSMKQVSASELKGLISGSGEYAEFDPEEHPRGKTTPGSRGGSFAPKERVLLSFDSGDHEISLRATGSGRHYVEVRHIDTGALIDRKAFNSMSKAKEYFNTKKPGYVPPIGSEPKTVWHFRYGYSIVKRSDPKGDIYRIISNGIVRGEHTTLKDARRSVSRLLAGESNR